MAKRRQSRTRSTRKRRNSQRRNTKRRNSQRRNTKRRSGGARRRSRSLRTRRSTRRGAGFRSKVRSTVRNVGCAIPIKCLAPHIDKLTNDIKKMKDDMVEVARQAAQQQHMANQNFQKTMRGNMQSIPKSHINFAHRDKPGRVWGTRVASLKKHN
jgi:hypothetical protein